MCPFSITSDLVAIIDEDDIPPPIPPRHPDMLLLPLSKAEDDMVMQSLPLTSRGLVRRGSEHNILTSSMVVGQSPAKHGKKSKTLEKPPPKGKKWSKKSDTFSGRGTPTSSSLMNSPVRNSTNMYFSASPSHAPVGTSASFSTADVQNRTPKKVSKWAKISSTFNKKFSRGGPNGVEAEENRLRVKPQRSQSIPSIKKCGVYSGRNPSICGEEMSFGGSLVESGSISSINTRSRKTSSSQGNSVNLVAKIFSVLGCWVEEYFEVYELPR